MKRSMQVRCCWHSCEQTFLAITFRGTYVKHILATVDYKLTLWQGTPTTSQDFPCVFFWSCSISDVDSLLLAEFQADEVTASLVES